MNPFDQLSHELQAIAPFRIRYKDEAWEMQLLNVLVFWFCPGFLSHFTTVIGSTIYFPSRDYVARYPRSAMRSLAHEAVHLRDAHRLSFPLFMALYLFPQGLALGVLLFPFLGPWALLFLLFLLPIPAPGRFWLEARAYAMDYLTAEPGRQAATLDWAVAHFSGWNYYRMFPFSDWVRAAIVRHARQAEGGQDKDLMKILLIYELIAEG
ncbi:MAG: hypothetical protein D6722_00095 [Bacteroidetes bacterium]|nr:MAG: hypothetical protein D6722_00095 [Bacteroidota bacterium]